MATSPAWCADVDILVLQALLAGDAEPMTIGHVAEAIGWSLSLDELSESLHRLQRLGLSEVWRIPGELAAFHRCTVTTVDVEPVDLDGWTK